MVKTERQLQSGSQTFDYGGNNKDESTVSQGNKPYNYINDPSQHANRSKIRTKTPNIPRLPIDKISNTPTSLNNNSQKKIINLNNMHKNKAMEAVDCDEAAKNLVADSLPREGPEEALREVGGPSGGEQDQRAESLEGESGMIDVNMFR